MKERIETLKDKFIDYAGKEHWFVIAAVSTELEDDDEFSKRLGIGYAICNCEDEFSDEFGRKLAIGRAKNRETALYSTHLGLINSKMVQALLEQEADYLKNNPEKYIAGYLAAEKKYNEMLEMDNLHDSFSDIEKSVTKNLQKDPTFLDKVKKYLTYWRKYKE